MVKLVRRRRVPRKGGLKKRVGYRKRVIKKRVSNVPDIASLSCKRTIAPGGGGNYLTNNLYSLMNTQLVDYQRAATVASAYQHYRIKSISLTFKPTYDIFTGTTANAMSKMHLYWMLDKSGSIPTNITLEGLKQMGARPIELDEKQRKITWRPSVLEAAMYAPGPVGASQTAKYLISPWLATSNAPVQPGGFVASGIDHLGIYWYMEQLVVGGAPQPYQCEVEVQFQFKKPLVNGFTGAVEAIPSVSATINDSKDGVVGGGDGV